MKRLNIRNTLFLAESWNVAWREGNPGKILSDVTEPFNIIENSFRYWAADPFIYERNGDTYIFAELYDYILCRGILGCCKLNKTKRVKWTPIITEDHHLSYPCIFEIENRLFLLPESSEGKELVVYEATEFPYKWEKKYVIRKDVCYADTTPIKWGKHIFALTHQVENPYDPKLLFLDFANKNNDSYIIQASAFQSRPAGHAFRVEQKQIRPAQLSLNCDEGYGKGLLFFTFWINEEMNYSETLIKKVLPSELNYSRKIYIDGMHTYNSSEHYEVIDLKTRRFNILNFVFRILNKVVKQLANKR